MFSRIRSVILRGWQWFVVRVFYNDFTIGKYFRKHGAMIGNNTRIQTKSLGSEPYLVRIGNNTIVSSNVMFLTHDGGTSMFRKEVKDLHTFGKIDIKDDCMIGSRSIIMPGVTIGPNSIIGAGSYVNKDVPPGVVVVGMPARVVCPVEDYKRRCIEQFHALGLQGPRSTWKEQLIKKLWGDEYRPQT